jgi:hypothetical protein
MDIAAILSQIDGEIARLNHAKALLTSTPSGVTKKPVGRPKKTPVTSNSKRVISAEGKARIAAAQKKRWAATRKAGKGSA